MTGSWTRASSRSATPEFLTEWGSEERRALREVRASLAGVGRAERMAQKIYDSHIAFMEENGLLSGRPVRSIPR